MSSDLRAARRVVLAECGSTSAEVLHRDPPVWVLAHRQTAARGRRGRPWAMPPGNFAASLRWRPPGGPAEWALRSFAASLALLEALEALGTTGLALKWPNDLLRQGGKLAGILLDSPGDGTLVLGIGVNLAAAPSAAEVEPGATTPAALDGTIAPEALLDALAPAFAAREAALVRDGFAPLRADWLARAARLGEAVTARTMTGETRGTFADVDGAGHLILDTPRGRRAIAAADVFFAERA